MDARLDCRSSASIFWFLLCTIRNSSRAWGNFVSGIGTFSLCLMSLRFDSLRLAKRESAPPLVKSSREKDQRVTKKKMMKEKLKLLFPPALPEIYMIK